MLEIGQPAFMTWWKSRHNIAASVENTYDRHERDFDLPPLPPLDLFDEYFEMVMQYGYATMFVATFPLAPLLALLNNVVEIRLDAYKMVCEYRRPVPMAAANIGACTQTRKHAAHRHVV